MKIKLWILIFTLTASLAQAQTNDLTSLLQQGLLEEQANRNLDAAIADYQALALQFDKNRQIAATAVFRLGECYRMQSKTNEAAAQYQRIVSDFSDQSTLVTMSRQNLTGMGLSAAAKGISPEASGTLVENSDVALWNKLKGLSKSDVEKILPVIVPDAELTRLLQQRDEKEIALAEVQVYDQSSNNVLAMRPRAALATVNQQVNDRMNIVLLALKLRAEAAQASTTSSAPVINNISDAEDQEIQRIQTMIQNSPDLINAANSDGTTPLQKAAANGWQRVATFLLDHGADINAGGISALNRAANAGNRSMVEFLLNHGANVNVKGEIGETPLYIAAGHNFQAVAGVLLANRADVNASDNYGETPLIRAAQRGNAAMVSLLLDHKADVNMRNNSSQSSFGGFRSPGSIGGRTALSYAAENGSPETVKMLLDAKADPNIDGLDMPLLGAVNKNDVASAELLLQAGANPNVLGIIDWNVTINRNTFTGRMVTPLFLAVSLKQFSMVQLLLKYKADPDDKQTDGQFLLYSTLSDTNILEALLKAGAKVEAGANSDHWSPLTKAANLNNAAAVEILLKYGANVNWISPGRATPLSYAAESLAGTNVFQLLLDYKANPNVRDIRGQTPLDKLKWIAQSAESPDKKILAAQLANLLRQHGALDKLPNWDRITVSRPAINFSTAVFYRVTNDWNQFTLLETILEFYGTSVKGPDGTSYMYNSLGEKAPFPDLTHITIVRPSHGSTNETRIVVNLLNGTNGINCAKDMPLQFGDTLEIPEYTHALAAQAVGLTGNQADTIDNYLAGTAELTSQGEKAALSLHAFRGQSAIGTMLNQPEAQTILRSSSDLSRVKVTRRDLQTGQIQTWTVDCSDAKNLPDLRVRNGDVIDVPGKP